jgi:nitrogen regulatory protein PII
MPLAPALYRSDRGAGDAARTGEIRGGKIFISNIAEAIRIGNDERGEGAL